MKKIRHHYVWRYYLRPWAENDKIWCCRNGSYFKTNLMNIAQERDFYKLNELTKENIEYIKMIAIDPLPKHLQELNRRWIYVFETTFKVREVIEKNGIKIPELDKLFETQIHNFEENLHSSIESSAIKYLKSILNEDLSFYQDEDQCVEFLYFICVQYMRTNNIKKGIIEAPEDVGYLKIDEIWNVLSHIFATTIGYSLYSDRKQMNLVLLRNDTEVEFIAGDQPIINMYATEKGCLTPPSELEFYYPISPNIAILLTADQTYFHLEKRVISMEMVEIYNKKIIQQSFEQIYSTKKCYLEAYAVHNKRGEHL